MIDRRQTAAAFVVLAALAPVSLVLVLAASPGRAAAAGDESEATARRHFNRGKQLYDERKYDAAAEEFEAGYAAVPKSGFLLNIAHSYRRAGDLESAKRYYELYLEKEDASPQRGEVQGYLKTIDEALADQKSRAPRRRPRTTSRRPGRRARGSRPPRWRRPAARPRTRTSRAAAGRWWRRARTRRRRRARAGPGS